MDGPTPRDQVVSCLNKSRPGQPVGIFEAISNKSARVINPQTGIVGVAVSVTGVELIVMVKLCVTLEPEPLLAVTVPE